MSVLTSSAVPMNCAYCGRPVLNNGLYYSGLCYHEQCTNPPQQMHECNHSSQVYLEEVIARKNERISLLEKVVEAGIDIWLANAEEIDMEDALRAAGYLQEQDK